MCMIWNIPTGDDDDGNAAAGKPAVAQPTAMPLKQPETGQGGTQAPKGEDIVETTAMNERAAKIADIFSFDPRSLPQLRISKDWPSSHHRIKPLVGCGKPVDF